ncbi:GNAT family N-acetyltransferase [Salinarimonas sp.]|uniref:GNAT family N-acetyltransferase n=1 Tax=Salinarimonas sp. TaxID=2766526 RepID=UPI00391895F2
MRSTRCRLLADRQMLYAGRVEHAVQGERAMAGGSMEGAGAAGLVCALDGVTDLPPGKIAALVTYLEMRAPPPRAVPAPRDDLALLETTRDLDAYRAFYARIGAPWLWSGRLRVSDAALERALADPRLVSRTLHRGGAPVGLVEVAFDGEEAELVYCGLVPEAIGEGLGAWLMAQAIAIAFARPIARLMVHTCSFDHPAAIRAYMRAGFAPYKRAIEIEDDPRLLGLLPRDAAADRWPVVD